MAQFVRPMNVHVAPKSMAEEIVLSRVSMPVSVPDAIAPGIHPDRAHDLQYHGGRTIQHLTFTNFYVGTGSWQQSDMQAIDSALAAAMADQDLNNVMMQYFHNKAITSTFKPSKVLPGSAPTVMSQGDVEKLVEQLYTQGMFQGFDFTSTVFNFMLPSGSVLNDNPAPTQAARGPAVQSHQEQVQSGAPPEEKEADSLNGLGGYHGSIHVAGKTIYYAVGVYSETRADGTVNGIPVFDVPWKNVVATFYHELNEARTDADVEDAIRAGDNPGAVKYLGWTSQQGEECGDYPVAEAQQLTQIFKEVPLTHGKGTVPVQFQYSNAVHGPEGPIPSPHHVGV